MAERREERRSDRRRVPRGGRRPFDRPGRHPVVLVANSRHDTRLAYVRYLSRFGFRVEEAVDGEDLLTSINVAPPHVILAERQLPLMPASRLIIWLAQNWRTRRTPMIVMDTLVETVSVAAVDESDALVKPERLANVLNELREALRNNASTA